MPVLVNCPSCSGPLRVSDELIGRKVRCPSCQTVFEANEPPPPPQEEPSRAEAWKSLDLELSRNPAPPPVPPPPAPPPPRREIPPPSRQEIPPMPVRGLVGAVEVDAGPQEPPRRPAPPPPPDDRGPARGGDDRSCPTCQKRINRDATRCSHCGERLGGRRDDPRDDGRDFRRRSRHDDDFGRPRRDSEPHRATTVLVLGIISLVCLIGTCFLAPNLIGVVLGVIGWWMGQADLGKMKAGSMDQEGQGVTQAGWICAIIGTFLNLLCALACGGIFLIDYLSTVNQANQPQPGGFNQPPAKRKVLDDRKK